MTITLAAFAAWCLGSIITGLVLGKALHICETREPRRNP